MNISLTPELEKFIKNKLKSGLYKSSSEVIREALRLLEKKEAVDSVYLKITELRNEIEKGIGSLESGKGNPLSAELIKSKGQEGLNSTQPLSPEELIFSLEMLIAEFGPSNARETVLARLPYLEDCVLTAEEKERLESLKLKLFEKDNTNSCRKGRE
jgi:antitoxin ParD1/3/4